jgi:SSS family solute:Na+ symporter
VQIAVAVIAMAYPSSALDKALSVASLINGPVLGVFLVGTFLRRVSEPPALIGMLASIVVMLYVNIYTPLAWTWYVLLGSGVTFFVAWLAGFLFAPASAEQRDELAPTGAAD